MKLNNRFVPLLISFFMVCSLSPSVDASDPVTPLNPSRSDCVMLNHEWHLLLMEAYRKSLECMRSPPQFGYAMGCKGREYRAWSQCEEYTLEICELQRKKDIAIPVCFERCEVNDKKEQGSSDITNNAQKTFEDISGNMSAKTKLDNLLQQHRAKQNASSDPNLKQYFDGSSEATGSVTDSGKATRDNLNSMLGVVGAFSAGMNTYKNPSERSTGKGGNSSTLSGGSKNDCSLARQQVAEYDRGMAEMVSNGSVRGNGTIGPNGMTEHVQAYQAFRMGKDTMVQYIRNNCK